MQRAECLALALIGREADCHPQAGKYQSPAILQDVRGTHEAFTLRLHEIGRVAKAIALLRIAKPSRPSKIWQRIELSEDT